MRCIYCYDVIEDDEWVELADGKIAHAACELAVRSQRRRVASRQVAVKTRELTEEDAERMIQEWETELNQT